MKTSSFVARPARRSLLLGLSFATVALMAGCSSEGPPSHGSLSVAFPSTAAAVATDSVQFFVFDVPADANRSTYCGTLIQSRKRKDVLAPQSQTAAIGICDLVEQPPRFTVPYGEHAVLAVGVRKGEDFLIGCVIQTYGDGDPLLSVPLALVDVSVGLPQKTCPSVESYCTSACQPG